jgi:hypothetical protein
MRKGASVPDQALVATPSSPQAVSTEGFDPSREEWWTQLWNERMRRALAAFPAEVAMVLEEMGDGESVPSVSYVAEVTGVPIKRIREIHRGLRALGFADFGVLCDINRDDDRYVTQGSGYWLTPSGERLSAGIEAAHDAIATEARRAETTGSVEDEGAARKDRPNPIADTPQ